MNTLCETFCAVGTEIPDSCQAKLTKELQTKETLEKATFESIPADKRKDLTRADGKTAIGTALDLRSEISAVALRVAYLEKLLHRLNHPEDVRLEDKASFEKRINDEGGSKGIFAQLKVAEEKYVTLYLPYLEALGDRFDAANEKNVFGALRNETIVWISEHSGAIGVELKDKRKLEAAVQAIVPRDFFATVQEIQKDKILTADQKFHKLQQTISRCDGGNGLGLGNNAFISLAGNERKVSLCPWMRVIASRKEKDDAFARTSGHFKMNVAYPPAYLQMVMGHELGHGVDNAIQSLSGKKSLAHLDKLAACWEKWGKREPKSTELLFNNPGEECVPRDLVSEMMADQVAVEELAVQLGKKSNPADQLNQLANNYGLFCTRWKRIRVGPGANRPTGAQPKSVSPNLPDEPRDPIIYDEENRNAHSQSSWSGNREIDQSAVGGKKDNHPTNLARIQVLLGLNPTIRDMMHCNARGIAQNTSGETFPVSKSGRPYFCAINGEELPKD